MRRVTVASILAVVFGLFLQSSAFAQSVSMGGASQLTPLSVEVPGAVNRSTLLHHADGNQILHIAVCLPLADEAGMESFVDGVSDPKNPNYRHFITPQEVGARFGLPLSSVQAVSTYLKSYGFNVRLVAKNRLSILADGTVAQAEAAFHTPINDYRALSPSEAVNTNFFSFAKPLELPASLAKDVMYIDGLESHTKPVHRTLTPTQTRTLYDLAPLYGGGAQGQGRTVGITSFDGFRLSNVPLFYAQYGLPTPAGGVGSNITVEAINGGSGSGTPAAEGDVDIQMVLGAAPLCHLIVYDGSLSYINVLVQEVNDNTADVITESYGWSLSGAMASAAHTEHLSMSAQGITYMGASGDTGTNLQGYDYPDYDPDVLMVGGTVASTDGSGNRTSEVGWSGSGGGWVTDAATFNVLPFYQVGTGVPTGINYRLFPDVALNAGATYYFYFNGSLNGGYCGTSFASPVFAGSLADVEQQIISQGGLPPDGSGHQRFGRIQDLIYSQNGRSDVWHDITSGSNGTLPNGSTSSAGPGWDMVTGWGCIDFNAFVGTQVSGQPDFGISASPSSQSAAVGSSATYTVTLTAQGGFNSATNLTVSGLPTGANGSFNPVSVTGTGSSVLTVSTAANTPTGNYTLTITGTSGSKVHSTSVTLAVTDFSIGASPASQSVSQGSGTTYTATLTAINGFNASTALSVSGIPTGASGSFSPASLSASGSSTLTVNTSASTPTGTYTLTVTGTSGSLVHSATVSLVVTAAPNFTIGASPASQTVVQGSQTTYTATLTAQNGFNASTNLSVSGLPTGAGGSFSPAAVTGSGTSTLTVTTAASTPTGTYTLTITGTSGSLVHSATAQLVVNAPPDFTVGASPASQTVAQGSQTTYTATLTAQNGFNASTNLSVSGLPTGAGGSFSPAAVTGSGTSTLTVTTAASTPTGTYTLTVTGTSGSLVHSATVSLIVSAAPDFTIGASPASQTVIQGSPATYTATLTAQNGFNATTNLSVSGLPTGANGSFSPTSVTGSGTSTLTVTTAASTPTGTYALTITGTSGSLVHSATVSLIVNAPPDFSIAASPASQTAIQGSPATYTATLTAQNGFNASTNLSVTGIPSGAGGSFSPASVTGSGASTLTVTTSASTPTGTYTLTITGTSGSLVHSATVQLVVNQPADFGLAASPASQTVVQGSPTTFAATLTAQGGFNSAISLSVTGLPSGAGGSFSPASVTGSGASTLSVTTAASTPAGTYTLTIKGTSGSLSHSATVQLVVNQQPDFTLSASPASQSAAQGSPASYTATIGALYGFNAATTLSVSGLPSGAGGSFDPASVTGSGSSTLTVSTAASTPVGTYTLTITATSGSLVHTATVQLVVTVPADFALSASPASQSAVQGGAAAYTASVSAQGGFNSAVGLSVSGLPEGANGSFSPASISGSGASVLTVTTSPETPPGAYTLTVTGISGSLVHSSSVQLVVTQSPDFNLSASPASQSVLRGSHVAYTASVSALNGFAGTVGLSIAGLPAGASATFSPTSISHSGSSALTVTTRTTTPYGSYTLTITGTSGGLVHSASVTLVVTGPADFSLAASPASQSTVQGQAVEYGALVSAFNGFAGNVSLSVSGMPMRTTYAFNPGVVPGGSGDSILTVTPSLTAPTGTFTLTITATSGSLRHTAQVRLIIGPHPDFLIAASPTGKTLAQGAAGTYTHTITAKYGFTGQAALSVAGLPAGANASFSPASVSGSGSSVMTVTCPPSTPSGTYRLTVTGTSGSLTHSAIVTLTVSGFTLAASPTSRTIAPGASTTFSATIGAVDGFTGSVALSVSGLPDGVAGTFSKTSITNSGSSTLTVTTPATTAPGTYPLTITAVSGGVTRTIAVTLIVS